MQVARLVPRGTLPETGEMKFESSLGESTPKPLYPGIAQLEECLARDQEAVSSNLATRTKFARWRSGSTRRPFKPVLAGFKSRTRDQMALSSIGRKTGSQPVKQGSTP